MRNALLPPVSSQIYSFGNSQIQIPDLDISVSLESKIFNFDKSVNGGGTFNLDSKIFNNDDNQLTDGGFGLPYQSYIDYPPGYASSCFAYDRIEQQQSLVPCRNEFLDPWFEMDFQARQLRKHTIDEVSCMMPPAGMGNLVGDATDSGELKKTKRKRSSPFEEQWRDQAKESKWVPEHKAPVKRSQKLSDRITALQKLVSPYGKTDTAAVLQEAVLYIKLLQDQIQNLVQTLRSSHCPNNQIGGQVVDLKSRGLCLVPASLKQKLALQEGPIDPLSYLRETI